MQNQIEKKTKIESFVRIKPKDGILEVDNNSVKVFNKNNKKFVFTFDKVFGPASKTAEIFSELKLHLDMDSKEDSISAFTILAYGQTGSGKTFTISGNQDEDGLIQMIISQLIKKSEVLVSFIEIYNEKVYDAIESKEKVVREMNEKFYIQDLSKKSIKSMLEFKKTWGIFESNRKIAETRLNMHSSRSHTIIRIESGDILVNLVDLAGSENNKKTGNTGERMKESQNINTSLFVLNKVVNSIITNESRTPYRDSKLTRLLKESLTHGRCFIIATVIDEIDEAGFTTNTLNFASKSRKILTIEHYPIIPVKELEASCFNKKIINRQTSHIVKKLYKEKINDELKLSIGKSITSREIGTNFGKDRMEVPTNNVLGDSESQNCDKDISIIKKETTGKKIRKNKSSDSSSTVRGALISNLIEMTPITKQKSKECFINKAIEYENAQNYKMALDTYKTINKIAPSEDIEAKIELLAKKRKSNVMKLSVEQALKALNSGAFFEIKKLPGVGDKRAQIIADYVKGGNFFDSLDDLKLLFSEKIVEKIFNGTTDNSRS